MAHVEADPLAGAALGEREQVVVLDDVAARLAVEAMGDDVSGREDFQHLVEERRRLADMDHERQAQDLGDLLCDLDGRDAPGAENDVASPHLDADDDVTICLDAGDRPVDVDGADVDEFAHAVAGDEADRADVEEGADALPRRLDHDIRGSRGNSPRRRTPHRRSS